MFFERSGFRLFSIADIAVAVSPWYAILMVFIIWSNGFVNGLLFALAITISILIHEFGHAIPSKLYDLRPSILLHGFGGLCFHQPADSDWKDILIVVAGPLIQIAVGGLVWFAGIAAGPTGTNIDIFLYFFFWVSVIWGALNLFVPMFPLDGGQLFHLLLRRFVPEHKAQDWALKVSVTVAIPLGILAVWAGFFFGAIICLFIIMDNVGTLRSGSSLIDRRAKVRTSNFVKENLAAAEAAYADEDWREAARLCHVIRAANDPVAEKQMDRIWELLGLATMRQGEWEEALAWLEKAPQTTEIEAAIEQCRQSLPAEDGEA